MRYLKGYGKRYFSLAIIAMYSTIDKLSAVDINYQYHITAWEYQQLKTGPPLYLFN
jgi:hypothetical protein